MKTNGKEITKEMLAKAEACKTAEELVALAKENGVELTAEEAAAYLAEHEGGKLTGEELDAVAGGKVMKPGGKHKGCFLTTAVCEYLGKADDSDRGILRDRPRHRSRHEGLPELRRALRRASQPLYPPLPRADRRGKERGMQAALYRNGALRGGTGKSGGVSPATSKSPLHLLQAEG